MSNQQQAIESAIRRFADVLQATYATALKAQPEDQLKQPVKELLASVGTALGWEVDSRTEVAAPSVGGRPDLGVMLKGLLSGHVELKAPGKGARTERFKTTDRIQWQRFQALPNLVYTDGEEWALYRSGERVGRLVRLGSGLVDDGAAGLAPTGRKVDQAASRTLPRAGQDESVLDLDGDASCPPRTPLSYRSLDRHWLLADHRVIDRAGPPWWFAHSGRQVYLTSLLTGVIGLGSAGMVGAHVPDLHHYRGSFGGRDVIPLWRDPGAREPNVTAGLLDQLSEVLDHPVEAEDLFAYCYAVQAGPSYVERFSEELTIPGPRIPITKEPELFSHTANLGRRLIFLHTYGERFGEPGEHLPQGTTRCTKAIPSSPDGYPESFTYDEESQALRVGAGEFAPVTPEVWELSVSGFEVVKSWLAYRMKEGAGRRSSPLDEIRPERWTSQMTDELLELLWVLEATVELFPELERTLDEIVAGELFLAADLPEPRDDERKPPKPDDGPAQMTIGE